MKKIEAIIRHSKLEEVSDSLADRGFDALTVTEVRGFGRQCGQSEIYRGVEYVVDFIPKIMIEVVVHDDEVQAVLDTVSTVARCGDIGDGKIFVSDVSHAVRIRNAERGEIAL